MGLVLISWIGPKVNGLDLRSGSWLGLSKWVGPDRLGWA